MRVISILELEAAIRRCCVAQPAINYVFSPEVKLLQSIWAEMVYRRRRSLDLARIQPMCRMVVERWLTPDGDPPQDAVQAGEGGSLAQAVGADAASATPPGAAP